MHAEQIAFPFRARNPGRIESPSNELIGRSYIDGHATITVVSVCFDDDKRVMVERDLDGPRLVNARVADAFDFSGKEARGLSDSSLVRARLTYGPRQTTSRHELIQKLIRLDNLSGDGRRRHDIW